MISCPKYGMSACMHLQAWALAGIAVYGVLTALNFFWFCKLMQLALKARATKQPSKALAAVQPSSKPASVSGITAVSAQAAWSDVNKSQAADADTKLGRSSAVQHSQQKGAAWIGVGQEHIEALQGLSAQIPQMRRSVVEGTLSDG